MRARVQTKALKSSGQVLRHAVVEIDLLALFLLILGNGAFKPNISTQVGNLYPHEDPRKDGAYTIFYMGINVGAALSSLVCGALGEYYGWDYGFDFWGT